MILTSILDGFMISKLENYKIDARFPKKNNF